MFPLMCVDCNIFWVRQFELQNERNLSWEGEPYERGISQFMLGRLKSPKSKKGTSGRIRVCTAEQICEIVSVQVAEEGGM